MTPSSRRRGGKTLRVKTLRATARRARATTPKTITTLSAHPVANADAEIMRDGLSVRAEIRYRDAAGRQTRRRVEINAVLGETFDRNDRLRPTLIVGRCALRAGFRNFRIDRIASLKPEDGTTALRGAAIDAWLETLARRKAMPRLRA